MRPLRGIILKVTSVLVFIAMQALIKTAAQHVPAGEAVFFRSFFAIPVIVIWLAMQRELATGFFIGGPDFSPLFVGEKRQIHGALEMPLSKLAG